MQLTRDKENNNILSKGSNNLNVENWLVYHPNGKHMFTCGEKKADWYIERGLAVVVGDNKIKFTFEPKGNGFDDNEIFGKSIRENRCVVTGIEDGLQRHHIVPYCYRTFFPEEYKSKNHHDVVLIHYEKHSEYEQKANDFKDCIAQMYGVKTINEYNTEYTYKLREMGKDMGILLNTIHSFFNCYNKIPQEVKISKLEFISANTGIDFNLLYKYNYIQLYKLYLLIREQHLGNIEQFKEENRLRYDHGFHVVQKLDSGEKIEEFVKLWRKHFIETMQPKYMPEGWSVDFRIRTKL